MGTTTQISVTLPNDMASLVRAKVQAGEYANESEMIRDGLSVLLARDRIIEDWLDNQVGAAYDKLSADPSRAITVDEVRTRLAAEYAKTR